MSRTIGAALLGLSLLAGACTPPGPTATPTAGGVSPSQPYAGLQDREIRALAPERVAELLAGRGAGYALAAELNHYPGPLHVLQLAGELHLTAEQEQAARASFEAMQAEAKRLGEQLVDLEAELDREFRAGTIGEPELARLTDAIADLDGRLRATHLAAHLRMREILDPAQVARYDQLRGYGSPAEPAPPQDGRHAPVRHDGSGHGR